MAAQEAKYSVTLKEQNFELRVYEPHIVAETTVEGGFSSAGNKAFSRLFKYIAGNNT
ncbi:MAG TPA: heme-binding protein, partial [Thiopseudomonas sp.]|nr:heme-binding protein [Thiopseudomonas sp.]